MPLRSGPEYDSRPSVDERFPPWQTGSYTENRQYCGDLPAGSPTYGGDYSGRGGYGAGGESVDGGVDTDDAVDFGFPHRGTVD